jgi:hypothetical protein
MLLTGVLVVAIWLTSCGTPPETFEYQSDNETKPGRGVFTGDDGVWTIYRKEGPPEETAEAAESGESESAIKTPSDKADQSAPRRSNSE